jgi:hypothetical protein
VIRLKRFVIRVSPTETAACKRAGGDELNRVNVVPRWAMEKRMITHTPSTERSGLDCLPIDSQAEVEITPESGSLRFEAALNPGMGIGWRAAGPGMMHLRMKLRRELSSSRGSAALLS